MIRSPPAGWGRFHFARGRRTKPACMREAGCFRWLWLEGSFGLVGEQQDRASISGAGGNVLGLTCRRIAFGVAFASA